MDLAPMLLICTPIFLPVIKSFGVDPVHFGIIMILNLGIGLLTPPVGPTMVVGCAIGKVSMEAVSKSILVFYIPMLIVLFLVTYIPALSALVAAPRTGLMFERGLQATRKRCSTRQDGSADGRARFQARGRARWLFVGFERHAGRGVRRQWRGRRVAIVWFRSCRRASCCAVRDGLCLQLRP